LLPACKNIGVTHITNGAYRLHPIEWAIGEAQGALAYYCLKHKISPDYVLSDFSTLRDFQRTLIETGVPVYWFSDITPQHPAFVAAQYLAITGLMPGDDKHLHFYPDKTITLEEVDKILGKLFQNERARIKCKAKIGIKVLPTNEITVNEKKEPLNRAQFAQMLYPVAKKMLSKGK